jgi:hypothetical protein
MWDSRTYIPKSERISSFEDMADRLPDPLLKQQWKWIYGILSTISHPRHHALAAAVKLQTNTLRLGPDYSEDLFLPTSFTLLQAAVRSLEFIARLVPPNATDWLDECNRAIKRGHECLDQINTRAQPMLLNEANHDQ